MRSSFRKPRASGRRGLPSAAVRRTGIACMHCVGRPAVNSLSLRESRAAGPERVERATCAGHARKTPPAAPRWLLRTSRAEPKTEERNRGSNGSNGCPPIRPFRRFRSFLSPSYSASRYSYSYSIRSAAIDSDALGTVRTDEGEVIATPSVVVKSRGRLFRVSPRPCSPHGERRRPIFSPFGVQKRPVRCWRTPFL